MSRSTTQVSPAPLPTVFVIDDDACLRAALRKLFESVGLHVELFPSGDAFLRSPIPNTAGCIVLAVRLPGMSGPKFQEELAKAEIRVPIVFLTGYGDIPMAVRAIKAGAVDFLTKPFREQDLCWRFASSSSVAASPRALPSRPA